LTVGVQQREHKGQGAAQAEAQRESFPYRDFIWALGSLCALYGKPFDPQLLLKACPPPHTSASLIAAARELGFEAKLIDITLAQLQSTTSHALMLVNGAVEQTGAQHAHPAAANDSQPQTAQAPADSSPQAQAAAIPTLSLLISAKESEITYFPAGQSEPVTQALHEFEARYSGQCVLLQKALPAATDEDQPDAQGQGAQQKAFGFAWFVPELLKHKTVWRDVLAASLVLQLLALGLPLFTQAIIDKVVVHRTQSTLIALAVGMGIFMVFTAVLTWVRQYLVLHTGNRVDAVLAASVFEHLFKLPPRYFTNRPTGVIAARLHGVETIREFVSSAAVTLILDIPFLLIAVAIMFYYSVPLTLLALGILTVIGLLSAMVAPVFQTRLNEQFMLGARNQAFLTEYIAGFETVKSLQFEPQLKARYADYLAGYLNSGFKTKQIANTYNVIATTLEQLMTLLILLVGAWIVMNPDAPSKLGEAAAFTIGMLVAFQMFAGKLSQPVMRLVGLWQQFQQSRLAVLRLGDLMNAPAEPYSLVPSRKAEGRGLIQIERIAFRYAEDRPFLYENLSLAIQPGKTVALMGPSGSGKSTLAKLLQGFYWPTQGRILVDGIDIRHLSANELRASFGVVPQETVLFSGTVYDNLAMANPHANFEQVVQACKMAEIHSTIEALPQGYQTPIGERGAGLSGGQKQRLAIARALLKRPKVLIFDEATSALDDHTAAQFARTINALKGKVTMLFITHAMPRGLQIDEVFTLKPSAQARPSAEANTQAAPNPGNMAPST
jgi:ATP-binding cassette, subfamily B, bacterial HlyB/CyaB